MKPNQIALSMWKFCVYVLIALSATFAGALSSNAAKIALADEPPEDDIDVSEPEVESPPADEVDISKPTTTKGHRIEKNA